MNNEDRQLELDRLNRQLEEKEGDVAIAVTHLIDMYSERERIYREIICELREELDGDCDDAEHGCVDCRCAS